MGGKESGEEGGGERSWEGSARGSEEKGGRARGLANVAWRMKEESEGRKKGQTVRDEQLIESSPQVCA